MFVLAVAAAAPAWAQSASGPASVAPLPAAPPESGAASSAPAPVTLGEVVVTAQRRSETLLSVPASVEVVTGANLQAAHINNIANLQELSPSLIVTQSSSPSAASFTIRGVGTSVTDLGFEQSVGVYIDGVYRGRPGPALQSLVDIDQVEVLRGPQSTLFGRNNAAGAINITTATPKTSVFSAYGEVTYGNYDTVQARASVNVPLVDDKLAFRFGFAEDTHSGYVKDPSQPSGDVDSESRQGYRAQLLWTPTAHTRIRVIGDYSKLDDHCCAYQTLFVSDAAAGSTFFGYTPPTAGARGSYQGVAGTYYQPFDRVSYQEGETSESSYDEGVSIQIDQDLGDDLKLTGIGSVRNYQTHISADIDSVNSKVVNVESFPSVGIREDSGELRLQNESGGAFEWILGAYYFDQRIDDVNVLPLAGYDSTGIGQTYSGAVFGQGTYAVTNKIKMTGGVRYLNEAKSADVTVQQPGSFPDNAHLEDSAFMGTADISYEPNSKSNFYARYSRGFKSGAINLLITTPETQADPKVQPETTDAYEIGAKLRLFQNRLSTNLALFTETVNNLQVQSFNGVAFLTLNAAQERSRGVELDAVYRVAQPLTLTFDATYLDARYLNFPNAPAIAGAAAASQDLSGGTPANAPHLTLNAGVQFTHPLTDDVTFKSNVNVRYATSYYTDLADSPIFANGASTFLDANIEFALRSGVAIQFWGRNLTQQNIYQTGITTPAGFGSLAAFINDPRTYGLTLKYKY